MSASAGYILDTNVILALMRMNRLGTYIEKTFSLQSSLNQSMISVVTVGEMLSLGRHRKWGDQKFNDLKEKLS